MHPPPLTRPLPNTRSDGRGVDRYHLTGVHHSNAKHWRKHHHHRSSSAVRHNASQNRRTGLNEPIIAVSLFTPYRSIDHYCYAVCVYLIIVPYSCFNYCPCNNHYYYVPYLSCQPIPTLSPPHLTAALLDTQLLIETLFPSKAIYIYIYLESTSLCIHIHIRSYHSLNFT